VAIIYNTQDVGVAIIYNTQDVGVAIIFSLVSSLNLTCNRARRHEKKSQDKISFYCFKTGKTYCNTEMQIYKKTNGNSFIETLYVPNAGIIHQCKIQELLNCSQKSKSIGFQDIIKT